MALELIPTILGSGGLLTGIAAAIAVGVQRKNAKEDTGVKHNDVVLGSYGELVDRLEKRLDAQGAEITKLSTTVETQGEKIVTLQIELRERDDKITLLTLDRDDLIAWVRSSDPEAQPPLRTV